MGRVFRARHTALDRAVAVKFLPPELAEDPAFEARFSREGRALAKLSHPNIVSVHDFGTTSDGDSYLVMEFAEGGTLRSRIPLPVPAALRAMDEVCAALAYAHSRGLVHRDVKPDNVLFDENGHAKLADFGLARLVFPSAPEGAPTDVTAKMQVLGTPNYIAPEARAGEAPQPSMDVFSAGILLCVAITGELPSNGAARLPRALRRVVERATAAGLRERYPTMEALRSALRSAGTVFAEDSDALPDSAALPPDEESWMRAVALVLSGATALSIYAFLTSITPRIVNANEVLPFVVFDPVPLPGDKLYTLARFETVPVLVASGGWVVGIAAYAALRAHWRRAGLEVSLPDRKLPYTQGLLRMTVIVLAVFAFRVAIVAIGWVRVASYIPVIGGVLELGVLFAAWLVVLESRRTSRPLRREPTLWAGLGFSLVPPFLELLQVLTGRR
jgi:serine/threonine-protein kinase